METMTANNVTQPVPSNRYHRTNSSKQNDDVLDGKTNDVDDTYEFSDLLPLSRKLVRYMQHDDISDKDGMNADFVQAVQDGDIEKVSTLLQTTVRDINTITTRGRQRISVLQLAAEQNNFHLVKLLLQYGASKIKLPSLHAKEDVSDTLTSLRQYGALTSPAYICLTSKDPFKTAFELSWKLKSLTSCSFLHDLTHTEYSEMDRNVQIFSKDLLEQCHSSREVIVLLGGNYVCNGLEWWKSCKLPLLEEALEKQQKLFVGSLHCQQVLKQAWVYGQPIFTQTNNWGWFLIYGIYDLLLYGLLQPILSFIFIFFPCCSIAKIISAPRSKFLMMAFSYVAFLVLSTLAAIMKAREETEEVNTVTSSYYLIVAVTIWLAFIISILI
ncbi:transient-receptor-potential-like protein [Glandiceps talaboti]